MNPDEHRSEGKEFNCWAIVELFGHRKLGGRVSEAMIGGAAMIRIDIPREPPWCLVRG